MRDVLIYGACGIVLLLFYVVVGILVARGLKRRQGRTAKPVDADEIIGWRKRQVWDPWG